MCRSCQETPDGVGRRCPSRENGFTAPEADQRTRTRGLNAAQNALVNDDPQGAANALARAVSAQRELDNSLTQPPQASLDAVENAGHPEPGPSKNFTVAPSDYATMRVELDNLNADRARRGMPPVRATIITQRKVDPNDPMMQMERVNVQISGIDFEEAESLKFRSASDNVGRIPDTYESLAAAYAIVRAEGQYKSKADAGLESTAAKLDAYILAGPDSPIRRAAPITDEDRAKARELVLWTRGQRNSSKYIESVKASVANDVVTTRNLPLAVSAIPLRERDRENRDRILRERREHSEKLMREYRQQGGAGTSTPAAQNGGGAAGGGARPRPVNAWIGTVGTLAQTTGHVENVTQVQSRDRTQPHYLYTMRTDGGAAVKWFTTRPPRAQSGDRITVSGRIVAHEEYAGHRQTRFENNVLPLIHREPAGARPSR